MTWLRKQDGTLINADKLNSIELSNKKMAIVGTGFVGETYSLFKTNDVNKLIEVYEDLCRAMADYDINDMG